MAAVMNPMANRRGRRIGRVRVQRPTPAQPSARRTLGAVDDVLMELEELHLTGRCIGRHRACQQVVAALAAKTGETPPPRVAEARTSYALHVALLDWQSSILDRLIPRRRERFPDLQERDEWPVPRLRRVGQRSGRGRRSAAA